jgi:hypothetical protein
LGLQSFDFQDTCLELIIFLNLGQEHVGPSKFCLEPISFCGFDSKPITSQMLCLKPVDLVGCCGSIWVSLWPPLALLGLHGWLRFTLEFILQANVAKLLKYHACSQNVAPWNLPAEPAEPADPAEVVSASAAQTPPSKHVWGQDAGGTQTLPN